LGSQTSNCAILSSHKDCETTKEETRDHVLTEEDINLLWATTRKKSYPFEDLFKVLLLTVKRLREAARMRQENVDFDKAVWTHPAQ
jgi:integrase